MTNPDDSKPVRKKAPAKPKTAKKTTDPDSQIVSNAPIPMNLQEQETDWSGDLAATGGLSISKPPTEPVSNTPTKTHKTPKDDENEGKDSAAIPQLTQHEIQKNSGNDRFPPATANSFPGAELLESASRAKQPGEKRHEYWERMRKAARMAGLIRGQGPGTAYQWATEQTDREFPPPAPVIVEELPTDSESILCPIGHKSPQVGEAIPASIPVAPITQEAEPDVPGLGTIPESWPKLPPNAPLQAEIAWVSANRLRVRDGNGVNLSRALSPAPSYSALSWLETSILFPSKFADISVKATADQDTEKEVIKRERMAIEEIRSLLAEMLEAK